MIRFAKIMDHPDHRSSHFNPTPTSGGVAICTTFFIGLSAIYFFGNKTLLTQRYFFGFIVAAIFIAGISFYDDIHNKSYKIKLITQSIAAFVVIAFGIVINEITLPLIGQVHLGIIAYPITFLWIVGLTNAYNFMDGLDGLAAGVAVIISLFFAIITYTQDSAFVYITCYTILAGSLGFLFFNFPSAKIFMGDVGSAFLGYIFASIAIIAALYDSSHTSLMVMPLLVFHFFYDTFFTFMRRLLNKENVTKAHRTHLYQLFHQLGYHKNTVVYTQYAMTISQGFGAMILVHIQGNQRVYVFLPFLIFQILYSYFIIKKAKQRGLIA